MSSPERSPATAADLAACRALLRGGSRSFFAASFLLPGSVRDPAIALYAFCRVADDAIDIDGHLPGALARLYERLDRAYVGRPVPIAADRAFAEIVARFGIPKEIPAALLEGFAWDAEGRIYEDFSGVTAYSVRVAGTVGAMMAMLMGVRDPDVVARACDLGIAMQFSNIARDVGEDARNGRLYLPRQWLREAGIDPDAFLARPVFTEALGGVVKRLLDAADEFYARAGAGIACLPLACQPGIWAARYLYAEIGREVARAGYDSVSRRAVVSGSRKARLLARALAGPVGVSRNAKRPAVEEARFLVDAIINAPPPRESGPLFPEVPEPSVGHKVAWVLQLFDKLERLERMEQPEQRRRAVEIAQ
ncbi:phytoene/squalene synthase family protein [Rhodovastum atsumiense]|nr:phytoene/squalene synthase family protein [Rhodovastum atsumiense]